MDLDILLRGQSNAFLLATDTGQAIAQEVQQLLGFDGTANTVRLLANWSSPGDDTIIASSPFIGDWMRQDASGRWQPQDAEQGLLNFAARQPDVTSTAVVWLHSEYDGTNSSVDAAGWTAAVRADAALLRQALGQDAAHTPYLFVSAIPFEFSNDATIQAIRAGMENLSADGSFNGHIAARTPDVDMTFRFPSEGPNTHPFGGDHMSVDDAWVMADRIARSVAQEWAQYAQPGSPVALAGYNLANLGPQVVSATPQDSNTLAVTLAPDGASGLRPLDTDAANGLGWSVQGSGGTVYADHASITGTETLQLHFAAPLPTGGVLFYGYGYGRLAVDGNHPGEGNAVYDSAGLPAWTPATGVALAGSTAPAAPAPPAAAAPAAPTTDWYGVAAAQADFHSATGGYWNGSITDLLAWEVVAPSVVPGLAVNWNALAAQVMVNFEATAHWWL